MRIVIVAKNSENHLLCCLQSLKSKWADLEIIVIDNASSDGGVATVDQFSACVTLVQNTVRQSFAFSANQGARLKGEYDYLLLINPEAVAQENLIDTLLALAFAKPDAGIYGCEVKDADGHIDPSSYLGYPSLWSAICFATCLGAQNGPAWLDPDMPGSWKRDDTRAVPVLPAGLLLITADLWQQLDGLDEDFFHCGEDVDFCLRAREVGAYPTFTPITSYVYARGCFHQSTSNMQVAILRDTMKLYRKHLPPFSFKLARLLLSFGVWARAKGKGFALFRGESWPEVLVRKKEWL
ncbi:glycosyltransferase [Roseibium aggregatum]|uniref:glycosyltransferase n=1 Tax=Roseibium aggregatum TaxID=187304 RepID=UPI002E2805B8|nr:glycosyltransferase [Roseibium aggregatum]